MEKIDTDYKRRNLKTLAKLFKPFNRDWAPLSLIFCWTDNGGALVAQSWTVSLLKNPIEPP